MYKRIRETKAMASLCNVATELHPNPDYEYMHESEESSEETGQERQSQ